MEDGVEIERKFLVARMPKLEDTKSEHIRQGYFTCPGDCAEVRVRQKHQKFVITVKSGQGLERAEREVQISAEQFEALWSATEGRRIEKKRLTGHLDDGLSFELDVFEGALSPLRLVEVEFADTTAAEAFNPPSWFGAEVTDDPAYTNVRLAAEGLPHG